jgi:NADH-quinone oxidoreductase subunit E
LEDEAGMVEYEGIENNAAVDEILMKYPREQRYVLAILQDIQRKYKYIPREAMNGVAKHLSLPLSKLYSMATFYKALSLSPKGENIITVCDGTACHVRSSAVIIEEIQKMLGIGPGETSKDGRFSLETVNCLGSCAIAPVMVVNGKYYGKVTPMRIREIIREYGGETDE